MRRSRSGARHVGVERITDREQVRRSAPGRRSVPGRPGVGAACVACRSRRGALAPGCCRWASCGSGPGRSSAHLGV